MTTNFFFAVIMFEAETLATFFNPSGLYIAICKHAWLPFYCVVLSSSIQIASAPDLLVGPPRGCRQQSSHCRRHCHATRAKAAIYAVLTVDAGGRVHHDQAVNVLG